MNPFDADNYPTSEPLQLIAGDRWLWKRVDLTDTPPSAYSLKYALRLEGTGATEIEISATGSGTEYLVEVASATTAGYGVGRYAWQAYITRTSDSQRVTIGTGFIDVIANRDAATTDPRSYWRLVYDYVSALLKGTATKEMANYSVDGLQIGRRSIPELMALYDRARAEVAAEVEQARVDSGGKRRGQKVRVRLT